MINLLIIIILTVIIAGVAAYSGVTLLSTTQNISNDQIVAMRLEEAAAVVRANLRYISGAVRAPSPFLFGGSSYLSLLPSWISDVVKGHNGIMFNYCPYSSLAVAGTAGTNNITGGGSYSIQVATADTVSARTYVVTGTAPATAPTGTIAILTAATKQDAVAAPSCNGPFTASSNGQITIANGLAIAITAPVAFHRRAVDAAAITEIYAAVAASGDGSGRNSSNPMTLSDAMDYWRAAQPRAAIINLATGTYTGSNAIFSNSAVDTGNPRGMTLTLRGGAGTMASTIINGTYNISMPLKLQLENVTLGSSGTVVAPNNSTLTLNAVTLTNLSSTGGHIYVLGSSTISAASVATTINSGGSLTVDGVTLTLSTSGTSGIEVAGGRLNIINSSSALTITTAASGVGVTVNAGGAMAVQSGTVSVTSSSGATVGAIYVQGGGSLDANSSTLSIDRASGTPTYGIRAAGRVTLVSTSLLTPNGATNGVLMADGGSLAFSGSVIGSTSTTSARPTTGVNDTGAIFVNGTSASAGTTGVYVPTGGSCWNTSMPSIFGDSGSGDGSNSAPSGSSYTYLDASNRSSWYCKVN